MRNVDKSRLHKSKLKGQGIRVIAIRQETSDDAAGHLAEGMFERLGAEGAKHIYVDGGVVIAQALRAGLVDEVTVSIIPIVLGEGTPLAPKIGADVKLDLVEHKAFESGLVQLKYRVKR
ncbi:MAG: dihydrofolate reductase family protein [Kofleriaceae bacterium]